MIFFYTHLCTYWNFVLVEMSSLTNCKVFSILLCDYLVFVDVFLRFVFVLFNSHYRIGSIIPYLFERPRTFFTYRHHRSLTTTVGVSLSSLGPNSPRDPFSIFHVTLDSRRRSLGSDRFLSNNLTFSGYRFFGCCVPIEEMLESPFKNDLFKV